MDNSVLKGTTPLCKCLLVSVAIVMSPLTLFINVMGEHKVLRRVFAVTALILGMCLITAHADQNLTDLFSTKAFQGSWAVINKYNWLGWLMNFLISSFCLIGLWLVFYQRLVTLLYLSSRNLWDNVYEVKSATKGKFGGVPNIFKRVFNGEDGTGADAFISFFYGLLPNVKKYSDYDENHRVGNLDETDNALNYMLKTGPMTILLIFFLALGFSGTLGQVYGTIVDGMTAVADNAVTINLAGYVDRIFAAGNHYKFHIDAEGTNRSAFQQQIANRAYQEVIAKGKVIDGGVRESVGRDIEQQVKEGVTDELAATVTGKEAGFTDADWKLVSTRVILSQTQAEGDNVFSFPVPDGVFGDSTYVNVYLNADKTYGDYFNRDYIQQGDGSSGGGGGSSSSSSSDDDGGTNSQITD